MILGRVNHRLIALALAIAAIVATPHAGAAGFGPAVQATPKVSQLAGNNTFRFSVPYSFSDINKDLKYAKITCAIGSGPPTIALFSTVVAQGETQIVLNQNQAQGLSGTATVVVPILSNVAPDAVNKYRCQLKVSNGSTWVVPSQSAAEPWARIQATSAVSVDGPIGSGL